MTEHAITLEIPDFLDAGSMNDFVPVHVTGTFEAARPAYTYAGEMTPTDPPEAAVFDISKIEIYDKARLRFVEFPMSALSDEALADLEERCLQKFDA